MRIIIVGLGTIGKKILQTLSNEHHSITLIDENKEKIEELISKYDVYGVVGNGGSMDIQKEAKVKDADLVIALTDSDELNIFICMVARKVGAKNTIARVRNPEYSRQIAQMKDDLGISMLVNPEKDTATEIFNLLSLPSILQIEHFAKGKVLLLEIVAEKGCSLIGESLISLGKKLTTKVLICAVQRDNQVFIPSGNFIIEEGDKVHVTSDVQNIGDFLSQINLVKTPLKNIMIVGGGKISLYLAQTLSKNKYKVKIIESDRRVCEELAEELSGVTVVCGNAINKEILLEEGLECMDAFIALTDNDQDNMVISMLASKMEIKKTITLINNDDLNKMLSELGLNNNVSPKHIVANTIVGYIRAMANRRGSNALTMSLLVNEQVEAIEFNAKTQQKIYNKPLKELKIKENCLIACIIRDNQVIIPDGNSIIMQGDNVIVVTTHKNFDDLADIII